MTEPTQPRRRRFALSLRALMVLVLVIGGGLGWKVRRATTQRKAVAAIKAAGGSVKYDYQWGRTPEGDRIFLPNPKPWAPDWLRKPIGEEYFQEVADVFFFRGGNAKVTANPDPKIFETLPTLDRLERVCTLRYPLNDGDFARLVAMPSLKEVCFLDMDLTDAGLDALESSPAIEQLQLRFKKGMATARAIAAIGRQPRLKKVELIYIDLPDADSLAPLAKLTQLQYLRLNESPVDDACLGYLRDLNDLRELYLHKTQLSDAGVQSLAKLDKLDTVLMDGSKLTDAGLARLANHLNLKLLSLTDASRITDASLATLERQTGMTYLFLKGSNLTDAGLDHLKGMKLEGLAISGEGVTDAGLAMIQQMTTLKSLNIVGTKVTTKGRAAFRKARPTVSVEGGPTEPDPE